MNILQLGLNIDTFDQTKMKVLNDFIAAFDRLKEYENKVYNPVFGGGIVEFNTSLQETSKLLDEIKAKMSSVSAASSKGSSSKKEETAEMKEYAKMVDQAEKARAKLTLGITQEAKELAALKLQLSETSKALIEQAKLDNQSVQQKAEAKQATAEYREEQQRVVSVLRQLAIEQDKAEKDGEKQKAAALKAVVAQEELDARAMKQQAISAKELTNDLRILKNALNEQAAAYSHLHQTQGKDATATKAALEEYGATAAVVNDIQGELNKASGSAGKFGSALRDAFGSLRTIAYILPGIGIAGIFNLAYEAISKALEEMDLFTDAEEKLINKNIALKKSQQDYINVLKELDATFKSPLGNGTNGIETDQSRKNALAYDEASGLNRHKLLADEKEVNRLRAERANADFFEKGGFEKAAEASKVFLKAEYELNAARQETLKTEQGDTGGDPISGDQTKIRQKRLEDAQLNFNLAKENYLQIKNINEENASSIAAINSNQLETEKFNADQARKRDEEVAKNKLDVRIRINQKILAEDISSEKARISALLEIRNSNKSKNVIDANDVLNNSSSTPEEKVIAQSKLLSENKKAEVDYEQSIEKLREDYRQRRIKAETEIEKDIFERHAIDNERVYKNDEKTLSERLEAYSSYITEKQKLQEIEFKKDEDKLSLKSDDPTARLELEQLRSRKELLKGNIQADAEKQVYDIVYTSTQKQLKLIEDSNKTFENVDKQHYTEDLNTLNKYLVDKKIKYSEYKKSRLLLDESYRISGLDAEIKDDEFELNRLNDFYNEQKNLQTAAFERMQEAKSKYEDAKSIGNNDLGLKGDYDKALGEYNGYSAAVISAGKDVAKTQKELEDDRLKRAKANFDLLEQMEKEHASNRKAIEEGLYNLIKTYIDGEAQQRVASLQLRQETIDEGFTSEINAIQSSSLSAKDKTALDVQLNEQKRESDKEAQREERKIKHDAAVTDRDLALAHIAWDTEQAIVAALKLPPPFGESLAIERGILGAIAAATVLATPIPSYALGTENHPGGIARYGEDGWEVVKEPYKSPYLVMQETISYLPKGTEVIPIKDSPEFAEKKQDDGWEQTRWLAKQMNKNKAEPAKIVNNFSVDFGTEIWKQKILGN